MEFFTIIIIVALGIIGYLFLKGFLNTRYTVNENEFKQGGVTVNFKDRTININGHSFGVDQVTGMRYRSFSSNSKAKNVIIEIDDFKRPRHKIVFLSSGQSEKFMQRLSTALRKAGGPSFK